MLYITNVDLVNDYVYTKFGLNRSIRFQDIEQNSILTSIKGRNSVANLPKFELIQAFMHVLVTCKNEEDQIKNEGARLFTRFLPLYVYGDFTRRSRAANSAVHNSIWSNFELVRDFMVVLLTCKNEEDPIKNRGARVLTTVYIDFSDAQGQITGVGGGIWPKFEFIQAIMHVLVTCKNEDDRFQNEGARVFTRFLPL